MFLYDTQNIVPFAYITDIHYSNLSDLSWSKDGRYLLVTSIDGFCTFIAFKENELGKVYTEIVSAPAAEPIVDHPTAATAPVVPEKTSHAVEMEVQ